MTLLTVGAESIILGLPRWKSRSQYAQSGRYIGSGTLHTRTDRQSLITRIKDEEDAAADRQDILIPAKPGICRNLFHWE